MKRLQLESIPTTFHQLWIDLQLPPLVQHDTLPRHVLFRSHHDFAGRADIAQFGTERVPRACDDDLVAVGREERGWKMLVGGAAGRARCEGGNVGREGDATDAARRDLGSGEGEEGVFVHCFGVESRVAGKGDLEAWLRLEKVRVGDVDEKGEGRARVECGGSFERDREAGQVEERVW